MSDSTTRERQRKKALVQGSEAEGWAIFARAPAVRFAAVTEDGRPLLRTLSAVVVDGRLCFHGADDGEKLGLLNREVVAIADEVVAQVASHWIHPELACPASTYYLSAMARGRVQPVDDLARKARILTALMQRFQPEGGYAPIAPEDKRYTKVLEELLVAELVPEQVSVKRKLGQHRSRAQIERVLEGLWQRGAPGDLRAIRLIREAHPDAPRPAFLCGPRGSALCVAPDASDAEQVARLLEGQYWTVGMSLSRLARAHLASPAWVVARDAHGEVIGSARAISDGARLAWVMDVIVHPEQRGCGFGTALTKLLLAHPAVRDAAVVSLRTRDAQGVYAPLGFVSATGPGELMVRKQACT